jgi:hypothetical protein
MQYRGIHIVLLNLLVLAIAVAGCRPQVDVFAVEKELYAVYGVLRPDLDEQYIRISKVFQVEGDALVYAGSEDLSASGMEVSLVGPDTTYLAGLTRDIPRDPGTFFQEQAVYRILTPAGHRLRAGERYQLRINKPDDPDFSITAWTDVPTAPSILSPGGVLYSALTGIYTYNSLDFNEDQVVRFASGSGNGFELRLYVDFWDGEKVATARWGPTRIFRDPSGCVENTQNGRMCYEIAKRTVAPSLLKYVNLAPGPVHMLDSIRAARSLDSLSKHVRLEVTAVDTFLTAYLHSNTPFGYGLNLLMDRKEISNISGENIGIFGSINTGLQYIFLGPCTRFRAGLSSSAPSYCE